MPRYADCRRRVTQRLDDQGGFSLVEVVVALGIASMVLLALLSSSIVSVRAAVDGRQNQQAGDYLNEAVESVRAIDYGAMSMLTTDLAGDPRIVASGGDQKYNPGSGPEKVDHTPVGTLTPHISTADTSNGRYTTRRYLTIPDYATFDPQGIPSVRRLTVELEWTVRSKTQTRKVETLITRTRRGLPLPNYSWRYHGPATLVGGNATWVKNPGSDVSYGFALNNLGARDSWSLTASQPGWTFYLDADKDGLWSGNLADEPALTPANSGLIEPGAAPVHVVAHRLTTTADVGVATIVFSATSDAQPTVAAKTVTTKLTVVEGAIAEPTPSTSPSAAPAPASCNPGTATAVSGGSTEPAATRHSQATLISLYPHNGSAAGDTATQAVTTMDKSSSLLQSSVCNYSTEAGANQAGRYVAPGGAAPSGLVEWQFQPSSAAEDAYRGTAVMVLYVQCPVDTSAALTVSLSTLVGGTYTQQVTNTVTGNCSSTGFTRLDVPLAMSGSGFSIGLQDKLVVRVSTPTAVRLLYDTTAGPSRLVIGAA